MVILSNSRPRKYHGHIIKLQTLEVLWSGYQTPHPGSPTVMLSNYRPRKFYDHVIKLQTLEVILPVYQTAELGSHIITL